MKENSQEKSLEIAKNPGVFSKIKEFFHTVFIKKEKKAIREIPDSGKEVLETGEKKEAISFHDSLTKQLVQEKTEEPMEQKAQARGLQQAYEEGSLQEQDMTSEQLAALRYTYYEQIHELSDKLDGYKEEILQLKDKMLMMKQQQMES